MFSFKCKRCVNNVQVKLPPEKSDCTNDLSQWYHCSSNKGIPDDIISRAWDVTKAVSFIFHHRSAEKKAETAPAPVKKSKDKKKIIYEDDDFVDLVSDDDDDDSDEEYKS